MAISRRWSEGEDVTAEPLNSVNPASAAAMLALPSRDQSSRIASVLAISVLLHLLIALLFLAWPKPPVFIEPPSESTVQMLFATGPPDKTPSTSPAPQAAPETTLPAPPLPAPPAPPSAPQGAPEMNLPAPAPSAPPRRAPSAAAEPSPLPAARPPARHAPAISSRPAFPAPMHFSLGGALSPHAAAPSRPSAGRGIDDSIGPFAQVPVGAPPRDAGRMDPNIRITGAQLGAGWIELLHRWWNLHGYYPDQAAREGEDGTVGLHLVVDRSGQVTELELVTRSGSQWLDMGAQAIFRGAHLPPFPANTPEPKADIDLRINYVLIRQ